MFSKLLDRGVELIRKQLFLQSVIAKLFPNIESTLLKYATGLMLRYLHWRVTKVIQDKVLDTYCDISYAEYISIQTIMLCEYQPYVEAAMNWFLDFINQILKEDSLITMIADLRTDTTTMIADLRTDMTNGFANQLAREEAIVQLIVDLRRDIHFQLNPSEIVPSLLTADDLTHELTTTN